MYVEENSRHDPQESYSMSYSIFTIPPFDKQLKKLSKKYPSIKGDYADFLDSLEDNPQQGTPLGKGCYKVRMSIASKGKGKSGGARVITHVILPNDTIYLLSIFDKGEMETISDKRLRELLKFIE